jgi:hypothetical protein
MFKQETISVGDWWLVLFLMLIPLLNVVLLFRFLQSPNTNQNLKNALVAFAIPVLIIGYVYVLTGLLWG